MVETPQPASFFAAFAKPAWVIMMVAQMVLGLALSFALIMKYYMLVFGTAVCTPDDPSIANLIRCTSTPVLIGNFLIAMSAFRFAAFMFNDAPRAFLSPLTLALVGLFTLFMADVDPTNSTWALAAVIVAFLASLVAAVLAQYMLPLRGSDDEAATKRDAW